MNTAALQDMAPDGTFTVPCDVVWFRDRPLLGYAEVAANELTKPFWMLTVGRRRLVALQPLEEIHPEVPEFRLAGMIYTMGRSGSTLLAALLSDLPGVYVLREPDNFIELVDGSFGTPDERIAWARSLIAAYGNAFAGSVRHLVIKWSPFVALYAGEIAAAYPGVPTIFLHRDPAEVLVSLCEIRSKLGDRFKERRFHDGQKPAGFEDADPQSYADMTACLVGAACDSVSRTGETRALDYRALPEAAWSKVAPFFGLGVGEDDRRRMAETARYYSKGVAAKQEFQDDSEAKQKRADETTRALARRFVEPWLERLKSELSPL